MLLKLAFSVSAIMYSHAAHDMRTYDTMNIGIIECGPVPEVLRGTYVSYPAMFAAQLAPLLPGARFETVSVVDGETLTAPEAQDAWLQIGRASCRERVCQYV